MLSHATTVIDHATGELSLSDSPSPLSQPLIDVEVSSALSVREITPKLHAKDWWIPAHFQMMGFQIRLQLSHCPRDCA